MAPATSTLTLPPLSALAALHLAPAAPPLLPPEIVRRIIAHALALPPLLLPAPSFEDIPTPAWDELAGRGLGRSDDRRVMLRRAVAARAGRLMRVCKEWKAVSTKYLYAEPYLSSNLPAFARALAAGERKWSDLNLHPVSVPGRWVRALDLSRLDTLSLALGGYGGVGGGGDGGGGDIAGACRTVFPLVPRLEHLVLAGQSAPLPADVLEGAPFLRTLKSLRGIVVRARSGEAGVLRLLRQLPLLEVLEIQVVTGSAYDDVGDKADVEPEPLDFGHLHTLTLLDASGRLDDVFARSALPRLRRLVAAPRGTTSALDAAHGAQIVSLTLVARNVRDVPPAFAAAFPALRHLQVVAPGAAAHADAHLARVARVHTLTVPAWTRRLADGDGDAPDSVLFDALAAMPTGARTGGPRVVVVMGFKWVPVALGRQALATGESGTMRRWAARLAACGIELRDENGDAAEAEPAHETSQVLSALFSKVFAPHVSFPGI
ncbi:hypothetical protein Q5752_001425 [Cryptotrichosporon argae]